MKKSDIEEIFSSFLVDGMTMSPKILMIWKNNEGRLFEFRMRISREFQQDLAGIHKDDLDIPKDLIIDYPENNKEVDFEYLLVNGMVFDPESFDVFLTTKELVDIFGIEFITHLDPTISRDVKINQLLNNDDRQ